MIIPHITWMIRRHLPDVLEIEEQSFESPWTETEFHSALNQRNCIGLVAEHNDEILGFVVYKLCKAKIAIANLAVHLEYRRQGVGTAIIDKLKGKLSQKRQRVQFLASEQNLGGQLFLRAQGFRCNSIVKEVVSQDAYQFVFRHQWQNAEPDRTPAF